MSEEKKDKVYYWDYLENEFGDDAEAYDFDECYHDCCDNEGYCDPDCLDLCIEEAEEDEEWEDEW